MTMRSTLNSKSFYRRAKTALICGVLMGTIWPLILPCPAFGQEAALIPKDTSQSLKFEQIDTWKKLSQDVQRLQTKERSEGVAYMVSGLLVLVAGGIGYNNADTNAERFALSVSQSIGIGGIGYGAFQYFIGSEPRTFVDTVEGVGSLSDAQRDALANNYVTLHKEHHKTEKVIRIVAHALIGALNFYEASHAKDDWTKAAFTVIGGANTLAVLSLSF